MAFTSGQGKTTTSLSEINVTPLVDVVLVLLIIFMVTAPILQTGIDVQLPETKTVTKVNPEERAVISLSKDNLLYFRSEKINFNELGDRLKREIKDAREAIYVRADSDIKFKSVVEVLDAIRQAGFKNVQIVTKPIRSEKKTS